MAAVCLACSSQSGGASASVEDKAAACKSYDGVSTVQDGNPGDGEFAGSSVSVMVKSPWPSRTAQFCVLRSQRLAEIAVLACNQLGVKYGSEPEIEMSLYGPDLRELPLDNTLEAVCGNSNDSGCVITDGLLRLHLLPYKVLWEQHWCGEGAQRRSDVQQQQPRGTGDDIAKPHSAASDSHGQAVTSPCASAPDGQVLGAAGTYATQQAGSASSAAPAPVQLDALEEPDWLPLYWHLWMSDPEHTAGMPAAPPDGCPPVSFVHEAETPLNVSLDVFAGWMGIPPLGQASRQQPGLAAADAVASGAIAPPPPAAGDGPEVSEVRLGPRQEEATSAAARPLEADDSQRTQPPQTQTIRGQATQSKQQAPHPAPQTQQTQQPAEGPAQSGCGSWCRHMEWLRGGGTRMLRLLAAATSSSSAASSTTSDGGSGGGSSIVTSGGTSSASSSSDRGPRGSGSGSSNGDSSGKVTSSLNAGEPAAPQGGSCGGGYSSRRSSGSGTHGEVASLQCMSPGVEGGVAAEGQAATGGDLAACPGLQLLWLNRQVSYDASPAELGMCDQSVVALLNLCDKPDCAACLMTRGSLCGDVALIERALAAGGLGPVDDAQRPPGAHAADEAGNGMAGGSGIATSNGGPSAVVGKASVPSGGAKAGSRPPMLMPLGMAAANGYEEALKSLLERRVDDPNVCDKFGLPALWFAVEHAQPGCVRLLLQAGSRAADWVFATSAVAAAGAQGAAAGAAAAMTDKAAAERASAAAAAGLPLAVASYMGLCHAVEVGDVRTVRELLRFGACPYTPDDSNGTPYHMAIERGDVEILQALLDGDPAFGELQRAQADIYRRLLHASQRVERSEVAGCPCVQCNYRVAIRAAASPETEELRAQLQLVALPAVMDAAPPEAAVGLMAAMKQHGALLDAHDADGYTALHLAVRAGNLAAIRWLLQNGADPLERDALGYMPLHLLAHYGCSAAPAPAATAAAVAVAATAATGAGGACLGAKAAAGAIGSGAGAGGEAAGAADPAAAVAAVGASGAQLELAAARLLVEDARMPLGAKTTCFAYEADVRAEEKKLRAGALGAAASTRGGGRRGGAAATAAAKKRSRDPMLTVPLYGGHTAAQLALRYGRPLLLAYLLHRGAPMDLSSATSRHCLEKALEAGHSAAARILLSYVQQGKQSTAPSASSAASGNGQESRRVASRALKRGTGGAAAAGGGGDGSSGKCTPRDRSSSPPGGTAGAAEATAAARVAAASAGAMAPALPDPAALLKPVLHMRVGAAQPNGPMDQLVGVELQPMHAESDAWLIAEASGAESVSVEVAAGALAAGEQAASLTTVPAAATAGSATETTDGSTALLLERRKARRTGAGFVLGGAMGAAKYGGGAAACTCGGGGAPGVAGSVADCHSGKAACAPVQPMPNELPPTSQKHALPAVQPTVVMAPLPTPPAAPPPPTPLAAMAAPAPALTPAQAPPPPTPPHADAQRPAAVATPAPSTQAPGHATAVTPAGPAAAGPAAVVIAVAAGAPDGGSGGKEDSLNDTAGDDVGNEGSDEANGSKSSRRARRRAARREARKAAAAAAVAVAAAPGDAVAAAPATGGLVAARPEAGAAAAAAPAASAGPKSLQEARQGAAVAPAQTATPPLPPCQAVQPSTGLPGAAPAALQLEKTPTPTPSSNTQVPAAATPAAAPVCAEAGPLPSQPHVVAGVVPLGRASPWDRRGLASSQPPTSGGMAAIAASLAPALASATAAGGTKHSGSGIVPDANDAAAAEARLLKAALAVEAYGRADAEALEDDDGGQWKVVTGHRNRRGQVHGTAGAAAAADGAAAPQQSTPAAALAGPAPSAVAALVAAAAVGTPTSALGRPAARTPGGSGGSSSGSRHSSPPRTTHAILGDAAAGAASMPSLPGISTPAPSQAPSTSPTAAAGGNSPPAAAGQRVTGVKRVGSTTSASAAVDACGYIEVPRSLLYGKRGPSGQSPTAPTTAPSGATTAWPTAPPPSVPVLPLAAGASTATPAPAPPQAGGRPTASPGSVPSAQAATTPSGAAAVAATAAAAWAVTPPTTAGGGGGGGGGGGAAQSFAAAVRGEAGPGHYPAVVPPLVQQPGASTSAPLGRAASSSSASGPATSGLVAAVAASDPASAAGTPRDPAALSAAAPAPATSSSVASAAAAVAAAVLARGRNSKASGKASAANAPAAPAGEAASRAGCAQNSTANGSAAKAGAGGAAASTGVMQPPLSASKLNPQAHEFVPVRAGLPSGNSATSAGRPAPGAPVHLSLPWVQVGPVGPPLAASAGGRSASTSSAQPGPGLASASASRTPAGKAVLGGSAAPSSAAVTAVAGLGGGLLSPSPVPGPRHGTALHQPQSSPAPGGGLDGTQMSYTMYGSSAPVLPTVHSWPRAATPPLGASPLPTHMQHLQAHTAGQPGQLQPPPASPVAQVLSWQAVQPIQVLSSPIRRLPDLPDLYRAMVSPYCSFMAHSPRPTSSAGAAAAAVAAAAASAAVSASAVAVAAAATAAAVAEVQAAAAANGGQHPHQQQQQQPREEAASDGSSGLSSPERQRQSSSSSYNPLAAPLPQLSMLPHGLFCGEQLIRPTCTRLWGLDPLQQLRATQTSLDATIAAAFGVPGYLAATQPLPECASAGGAEACSYGSHDSGAAALYGIGGGVGDGGMGPMSLHGDAGYGGEGRDRLSSGGGGGGGMSSGIVRTLHSIFAEEDVEEERRLQRDRERGGPMSLSREAGAAAPPAGPQPTTATTTAAVATVTTAAVATATTAGNVGAAASAVSTRLETRSRGPSPTPQVQQQQLSQQHNPHHHHPHKEAPGGVRQLHRQPPQLQVQHHLQRDGPFPPLRSGPPQGRPLSFNGDWRNAVVSLFTGARTHSAPVAAQPAVAAAALWWTAVRQAPEPQSYGDDGPPVAGPVAAANGGSGRLPRPPGFEHHNPHAAPRVSGGGVWPIKVQHMHRKGSEGGGGGGSGGSGGGGGASSGGGAGGKALQQSQGLLVMTQRVQVVGPLDAESIITACLQGRLAPNTEVCGTLAGLVGPPPLELFEPLGALITAVQSGGGCYMLVEGW